MKKRFLHIIVLSFLVLNNLGAQSSFRAVGVNHSISNEESIHNAKTIVMFSPQYLWIDQFRIEIDRRIAHRHWITLAPHYIQNNTQYRTHWGYGLQGSYKIFTGKESSIFIGLGGVYTHHNLENFALDDRTQTDIWLYQTKISRYGLNTLMGRYIWLYPNVFCEIHAGIGYRLSNVVTSDGKPHRHYNRMFDLTYQGWTVVAGIRIGVVL